jgi:hypothetical protein
MRTSPDHAEEHKIRGKKIDNGCDCGLQVPAECVRGVLADHMPSTARRERTAVWTGPRHKKQRKYTLCLHRLPGRGIRRLRCNGREIPTENVVGTQLQAPLRWTGALRGSIRTKNDGRAHVVGYLGGEVGGLLHRLSISRRVHPIEAMRNAVIHLQSMPR